MKFIEEFEKYQKTKGFIPWENRCFDIDATYTDRRRCQYYYGMSKPKGKELDYYTKKDVNRERSYFIDEMKKIVKSIEENPAKSFMFDKPRLDMTKHQIKKLINELHDTFYYFSISWSNQSVDHCEGCPYGNKDFPEYYCETREKAMKTNYCKYSCQLNDDYNNESDWLKKYILKKLNPIVFTLQDIQDTHEYMAIQKDKENKCTETFVRCFMKVDKKYGNTHLYTKKSDIWKLYKDYMGKTKKDKQKVLYQCFVDAGFESPFKSEGIYYVNCRKTGRLCKVS